MQLPRLFRARGPAALLLAACVGMRVMAVEPAIGGPPVIGAGSLDLARTLAWPAPGARPESEAARQVGTLQVGRRAARLGITPDEAPRAWRHADAVLERARDRARSAPPGKLRRFGGSRASELNALLRDPDVTAIRVTAARLSIDEPVRIDRDAAWLDLGSATLRAGRNAPPYLLRIERATGVSVSGGHFSGGRWGVLVRDSADVLLVGGRLDGLRRGGIVATGTRGLVVARQRLERLGAAPVLLHGATFDSAVIDNEIVGNTGVSNWDAGVVVTDRNAAVVPDADNLLLPDRHGIRPEPIDTRLQVPRGNVVAFNRIALNTSSGLYVDGGVGNVYVGNRIEGNAKEGVCLDNGATANVLATNLLPISAGNAACR